MPGAESDVSDDDEVAGTRDTVAGTRNTGGDDREHGGDAPTTTGTGPNETFVGRVSGEDEGFDEETGAEARAEG